MEEKYYIAINDNERQGPFTIEQLKGVVTPETMVWNKSLPSWTAASEVSELKSILDPSGKVGSTRFNPPKSWLLSSLITFFVFSYPFGGIATYYASKVDDNYLKGDLSQAEYYSKKAQRFVIIGIILGLIFRPILISSLCKLF